MQAVYIYVGIIFIVFIAAKLAPVKDCIGKVSFPNFKVVGPGNGCPELAPPGPSAQIAKLCANTVSCTGMLVGENRQAIACGDEITEGSLSDNSLVTVVENMKNWLKKYVYYRKERDEKRVAKGNGPLGALAGYTYKGQKEICNVVEISGDHEACKQDTRCKGIGVRPDGTSVFCGTTPTQKGNMYFYELNNKLTNTE